MKLIFYCLVFFLLPGLTVFAQAPPASDTSHYVEILEGTQNMRLKKIGDVNLEILSGNVKLKQGNTYFSCDSCVMNRSANLFEAFGHIHIIDHDTTNIWSDRLRYLTDKKYAYLTSNVKMTDGVSTLTTNNLEYDMVGKIGTYKGGGKVVNKTTTVISKEGIYYTDLHDVYFKKEVKVTDPSGILKTDTLLYNTVTQSARVMAQTYIKDSSGREITTSEGEYNMKSGRSNFTQRTTIIDGTTHITGDRIASDDSTGISQVQGRGVVIDTVKGIHLLANKIFYKKTTQALLATERPLMVITQNKNKDSIYVTADTLFSARLSDLYKNNKDTLKKLGIREKDSSNRYYEAFRNVRVFADSLQSVCDSLFYSFKDSSFRLFYDPIVWSGKNQITGDTIFLYTKNKKADRLQVIDNSFLISEIETGVYNQIKSNRLDGRFTNGEMDSVRARGSAESVYFLQDSKDSSYTGVNQTKSDLIDIYFQKGELDKVVLRRDVTGNLSPLSKKSPVQARLQRFRWLDARRPKTKYDLFN